MKKKSINILIVDDVDDDIFLTKELLEDSKNIKFNIECSNSFKSGLQKLDSNNIDVSLVDYRLGAKDGIDFIRNAIENGITTPLILLTGNTNYEIDNEAMECGAADFLSKNSLNTISLERSIRYAIHQNKIEEELRLSNRTKDKFFSILAHDLKNPFGAITSYSEYLLNEFDDLSKDDIKDDIKNIYNVANNVTYLLDNLLNWSRIQTGIFIFDPQPFNINDLIARVINLNIEVANLKNVYLASSTKDPILVEADIDMISVVLRNLVSNAIKFTNGSGEVIVSAEICDNLVCICVSDTGVGIPKSKLNEIFKVDCSLSTLGTCNEKGTGLGLILCKELVVQNKGEIYVESELDKGSTFKFTLPKFKREL